jgi:hypothetical protein
MKKCSIVMFLMLLSGGLWWFGGAKTAESATNNPQLVIAQVKITSSNGQFITLYNNSSSAVDLSSIQLQYFNSFDLLKATSGKLISLSGKVPAHGYAVVDDGPIQACYQMTVNSVSLGLSSTAGFIQVSHFLGTSSPQVISILDDYIGWSKTAVAGAQTLPTSTSAFLQRKASDGSSNYAAITLPGTGSWNAVNQTDGSSPCDSSTASIGAGTTTLATSTAPIPFSSVAGTTTGSSVDLPESDKGLAAPQISEVLPNPAPPLTDADDEFIELYNSNDKAFDLSGFILQSGISTLHKYTFPDGTAIGPHQFAAFYSAVTGLSLSNSNGQIKFLDPGGNVLGQTDEYGTAKDGYAWVSAGGLWQWTTVATPAATNIISAPPLAASKPKTQTKAATAAKKTKAKSAKPKAIAVSSGGSPSSGLPISKLHPGVLAGVGTVVLLYALYEYRHDLANQYYKFRRHRAARGMPGQSIVGE